MSITALKPWGATYSASAVMQLPLLWFVLTISPELNPIRSVWILVIVYGFLFGAVTGFESVFHNRKIIRSTTVWWKRSSGVWWTAAAMYVAAAALSFIFVSIVFGILVSFYGVLRLSTFVFFLNEEIPQKLINAFLNGFFFVLMLYTGITNFPIDNVLRLAVIIPAIVASLLFLGFSVMRAERAGAYAASWIIVTAAAVLFVIYFNSYLSSKYMLDIIAFFAVTAMILTLLHPAVFQKALIGFVSGALFQWVVALLLNIYFFYVFTDYTQILQLI